MRRRSYESIAPRSAAANAAGACADLTVGGSGRYRLVLSPKNEEQAAAFVMNGEHCYAWRPLDREATCW